MSGRRRMWKKFAICNSFFFFFNIFFFFFSQVRRGLSAVQGHITGRNRVGRRIGIGGFLWQIHNNNYQAFRAIWWANRLPRRAFRAIENTRKLVKLLGEKKDRVSLPVSDGQGLSCLSCIQFAKRTPVFLGRKHSNKEKEQNEYSITWSDGATKQLATKIWIFRKHVWIKLTVINCLCS